MRDGFTWSILAGTCVMTLIMVFAIAQQPFTWGAVVFVTLFATLFLGIGLNCVSILRENRFHALAQARYPEQPWLWETRWQTATIQSTATRELAGSIFFLIIMVCFALIGLVSLYEGLAEGNYWTLLNIFLLIAAGYVARIFVSAHRSWRLSKTITLTLDTLPVFGGGPFSARVVFGHDIAPAQITARLDLIKIIATVETDGTAFSRIVDRSVPATIEVCNKTTVRVSTQMPAASPETGWVGSAKSNNWELVITVKGGRSETKLRYPVPVARTIDCDV